MSDSASQPHGTPQTAGQATQAPSQASQARRPTTAEFGGARATIPPAAPPTNAPEAPRVASYLRVEEDGAVTAFTGKAEVGQNIRTSLAQAVADELRLPLERVRLVMADTARVPFDRGTFGSRSTPDMASTLRRAAATAREVLMDRAAERWESDRSALAVREGTVVHLETGQSLHFAELTAGQPLDEPLLDQAPVTPAKAWPVAGQPATKVNARQMVTGQHQYASDVALPGMLHGKVLRPPTYGATLADSDASAVATIPGARVVRNGDLVGVVAPHDHLARQALATIRATWRPATPEAEPPSEADLFSLLKTAPGQTEGGNWLAAQSKFDQGDVAGALASAAQTFQASYSVAYIAHAPLEPRAAVAQWSESAGGPMLTVWTGSQRPFGVQAELMERFDLPAERVRVTVPDTGAGYGGKHTGEAAIEAARLAQGAGAPVKVRWSREDEFTWAYFRPAGLMEITAGLDAQGRLVAWSFDTYNCGASALRTPYDVPHQHNEFHHSQSPLRQGSYRALAATANTFARESAMDELAALAGADPLAFRRRHLQDDRLRAVLDAAAKRFGWPTRDLPPGHGTGLAIGTEKGSYVAACAEVAVDKGEAGEPALRVVRVVQAFECGAVVNPLGLQNQIEGAIVQGLGGALMEAIHFGGGRILNPRFSEYQVPRFQDAPPIEVVLVDRPDLPSAGAGETPIIGIAPAIANALAAATGERRRALPLMGR